MNLFIYSLFGLLPSPITPYVIGAPNGGHGKQSLKDPSFSLCALCARVSACEPRTVMRDMRVRDESLTLITQCVIPIMARNAEQTGPRLSVSVCVGLWLICFIPPKAANISAGPGESASCFPLGRAPRSGARPEPPK